MTDPKIAILGAGNVGGNLGIRLAQSGYSVRFGVRPQSDVKDVLARAGDRASALGVAEAIAGADVVFIAVPGNAVLDVVRGAAASLAGKIVVDCNNALTWKDGPKHAPPPEGSLTAAIAKAAPGARVVKAFNVFGAEFHLDPRLSGGNSVDVPIAGDDAEAKKVVAELATRAGFTPLDAGGIDNAAVLENLAILWIHLAMVGGMGRERAFKLLSR
jgi:8-hydroxy-5-deazaflavin:NADPH oxidoreductase